MIRLLFFRAGIALAAVGCLAANLLQGGGSAPAEELSAAYAKLVKPLIEKYCLSCHSTKAHKGDLDLERFSTLESIRKDTKPWQHVAEQVDVGEMPPKGKPQPTPGERKTIVEWARKMLDTEARARTGDPGRVPLRRLSNAEYDRTVRDLTGVDLEAAREFPADGAGGEGFTNAAESLSDFTPTLFNRYLKAAKEIAEHAVLLPDGFRFSAGKTRRDWTDESLVKLRKFYAEHSRDGRLAFQPYLQATIRHRAVLQAKTTSLAEVAAKEKLNPKYLAALWHTLTDTSSTEPLNGIRARWRAASEKDVASLAAEIEAWQTALWRFEAIGSYRYGATTRQVANDPAASDIQPMKVSLKPAPGQSDIVLYLASREFSEAGKGDRVVWRRPRFEGAGRPTLLLADYAKYGADFEIDYATLFGDTPKYLAAAAQIARDSKAISEDVARKNGLDPEFLTRWINVLALEPAKKDLPDLKKPLPTVAAAPLIPLNEKSPKNAKYPSVSGWRTKGVDLPIVIANSSDAVLMIPGTIGPHKVAVHPTPKELVAVAWQSPVAGKVKISTRVAHVHPACGNGVAWFLEHRRAGRATILAEGTLDLGRDVKIPERWIDLEKGDSIVLAVDARNNEHTCDLTEIDLFIRETTDRAWTWDLASDVANSIQAANPHADKYDNKEVWHFVKGQAKSGKAGGKAPVLAARIPPTSVLGQWRVAATNPMQNVEADKLAATVGALLSGPRPLNDKDPDRIAYDSIVSLDGMLLKDLDWKRLAKPRSKVHYGLPNDRFGSTEGGSKASTDLVTEAGVVTELRLPAALFRGRDFLVEGKLTGPAGERVVLFQVSTNAPGAAIRWTGSGPVVASPASASYKQLLAGFESFRLTFPWHLCFPNVVPTDEVVSLKMFHREDEPLERLFLSDEANKRIDHLWREHLFISQQAIAENAYLPQFIGYVTQDQPKKLLDYFESQRPVFKKRADEFEKLAKAAEATHLAALIDFASRAYRRPIEEKEKTDLLELYHGIRKKGAAHPEAFRGTLTRVLVAPAFLFRIENAPPGLKPGPVDDHALASRLSYFLWSSMPDAELRKLADSGKLRDPKILADQTRRMLKDERLRALAIEFGTQWIHVRGFDNLKEKNEKLFPTFDATLRKAIYEESILFFTNLFQSDREVSKLLDADYTFLNDTLAKHYGIPGVNGSHWRLVKDVRKYGRGGLLGLASVQAKNSGASRTSPVLRGNWVVETLLGEKLPRPPADVPILPDEDGAADKLTTRQMVEKHVSVPSCAVCHVRIDPYGFAFENFDTIGRWRVREIGGFPIDAKAKLRDGTEFEGIDGLRNHLLTRKKNVIVRLFCQRLLGYALGRATTLSDTSLIDEMVAELNNNDGRVSAAVLAIVRSPQFRMIRGADVAVEH